MEEKLSTIVARISDVEGRLGFLEDAERLIRQPLDPNLKLFGIGSTTWKTGAGVIICALLAFLKAVKAGTQSHSWRNCCLTCWILLHRHRWFIERAHRLGPRTSAARSDVNGRTLIAKFMRSGDRDRILRASQEKGEIRWEGKRVVIFPDFSRGTITKRDAFRECKKMLHQHGVKFALQYPATLKIDTKEGPRRFMNPRTAMDFIRNELHSPPEEAD
ncbi:hypothetical protein AMELA_G00245110 [Ameiurus melas]|uniref:Uncharacterized protein n=1 Tax=Ameiurus melas TaxID=219545 RepID=A0A7J5ZSN3_AMEME|nr:hypothetical protein AMELA_G00245110 [Ameiurus melas]